MKSAASVISLAPHKQIRPPTMLACRSLRRKLLRENGHATGSGGPDDFEACIAHLKCRKQKSKTQKGRCRRSDNKNRVRARVRCHWGLSLARVPPKYVAAFRSKSRCG